MRSLLSSRFRYIVFWGCMMLFGSTMFWACSNDDVRRAEPGDASADSTTIDASVDAREVDASRDTSVEIDGDVVAKGCEKMDILFVIDNSSSMEEEQTNLRQNFPRMVELLDAYKSGSGNALDYRVGVLKTGGIKRSQHPDDNFRPTFFAPDGALIRDCGLDNPWVSSADADPAQSFSCLANVGIHGSIFEMPLRALELAASSRVEDGTNASFFRDDALLAIVVLTDEDDCSRSEDKLSFPSGQVDRVNTCMPENLVAFGNVLAALDSLKTERSHWALSVIAGVEEDGCSSALGDAGEAVRLKEFALASGEQAVVSSICDGDLRAPLEAAMARFNVACESFAPIE